MTRAEAAGGACGAGGAGARGAVLALGLAAVLAAAGVTHLVAPEPYAAIVPRWLPAPYAWVYGSGVAELACAALLAAPRTRRIGGWASTVLLVVVFPANVQAALDGGIAGREGLLGSPLAAWLRLPLQIPLVIWAVAVARRATPTRRGAATTTAPRR
jgi:uncharacterized membrane protein